MKTTYKEIDHDKYEVCLIDERHDTEECIGYVYLDLRKKSKWYVHSYYDILLEDYDVNIKAYDSSVEAGRAMTKAYLNCKTYNLQLGLDFAELIMGTD
jgi:hypothetical protein